MAKRAVGGRQQWAVESCQRKDVIRAARTEGGRRGQADADWPKILFWHVASAGLSFA